MTDQLPIIVATQDQLADAVQRFLQAKDLEARAESIRKKAREDILALTAEARRTTRKYIVKAHADGPPITVTVPVSTSPAHFDATRTDEFLNLVRDTLGEDVAQSVFRFKPELDETAYVGYMKEHPDLIQQMSGLMLPFVVPESETELAPRLT